MQRRRWLGVAASPAAAGWLLAAPVRAQQPALVDAGLDWPLAPARAAFAGLSARVRDRMPDVQSAVVLHHGRLAFEFYRTGVTADTLQDVQSVTKSVLALLFGQAMADGFVHGPDELVAMRLPAMLRLGHDARLRRLRFAHLLGMTAGWAADETARRDRDDDLRQLVGRPFVADPGARFAYDNGAANLLALALANAIGEPLAAYAHRRLFAPLGIRRFAWRQGAQGHAFGALGLSLGTPAMARVGELVLRAGRWQDRALVPADWVRAATRRQNAGGAPLGAAYGYLWWIGASSAGRKGAPPAVMANGYGGQWIHVDPALELVAVVTSRRTPESAARGQGMTLIRRDITAAARRTG